jgi:hypothetical protein
MSEMDRVDEMMGQVLVVLGQGTGTIGVPRRTIAAIRGRYLATKDRVLPVWDTEAANVLNGSYYPILFAISAPALPLMPARARGALLAGRRRVLLFSAGLLFGLVPVTACILGAAVYPGLLRIEAHPAGRTFLNAVVVGPIVVVPFALA